MSASGDAPIKLILKDDYIASHIPKVHRKSNSYFETLDVGRISAGQYSLSTIQNSKAYSGSIIHINAGVPRDIFDEELYISTKADDIVLDFKFICSERSDPQLINKTLSLNNVTTEQLKANL